MPSSTCPTPNTLPPQQDNIYTNKPKPCSFLPHFPSQTPASILRHEKVSPWEIEPFSAPSPAVVNHKRPRLLTETLATQDSSSSTASTPWSSIVTDSRDLPQPRNSRLAWQHQLMQSETKTTKCCRIFGIDFINSAPMEQSDVSKETNLQSYTSSTRTRTKVQMQGVAVDLSTVEGYDKLVVELEEMFDIRGEIRARDKWEIVYTDDEGDIMLVGDDPWLEFCKMVRRILICSSEDVKKMRFQEL